MEKRPQIIKGGSHTDYRGTIDFMNDFDMSEVKRFYIISHPDILIKRGWRGHRIEQRWFYSFKGEFLIQIAKIDDFLKSGTAIKVQEVVLSSSVCEVLYVPSGYATLIQARQEDSSLLVFSDYGIENAKHDDHVYPAENFSITIE